MSPAYSYLVVVLTLNKYGYITVEVGAERITMTLRCGNIDKNIVCLRACVASMDVDTFYMMLSKIKVRLQCYYDDVFMVITHAQTGRELL